MITRGIIISKLACPISQEEHKVKRKGKWIKHTRSGTLCFKVICCRHTLLEVKNATAGSSWHKSNRKQIVECPTCQKRQSVVAGGAGGIMTVCPDTKKNLDVEITLD